MCAPFDVAAENAAHLQESHGVRQAGFQAFICINVNEKPATFPGVSPLDFKYANLGPIAGIGRMAHG
jgi:hypothetical protein